jgi:hypothetical protein
MHTVSVIIMLMEAKQELKAKNRTKYKSSREREKVGNQGVWGR